MNQIRNVTGLAMITLLMIPSCGIEVGNPNEGTSEPKTSAIYIDFAQVSPDFGDAFELNIKQLRLQGTEEDENDHQLLTPDAEAFELIGNDDEGFVRVVSHGNIATGLYSAVTVEMKDDSPIRFVDSEGTESFPDFEENHRSFYLSIDLTVSEDEDAHLLIDLDAERSLDFTDKRRPKFKPHADSFKRNHGKEFVIENLEFGLVCAYLYDTHKPPHGHKPRKKSKRFHGTPSEGRKAFDRSEDVVKDETNACPNAYKIVLVKEGVATFRFLRPGTYDFRHFFNENTFEDIENGTKLAPPKRGRGTHKKLKAHNKKL